MTSANIRPKACDAPPRQVSATSVRSGFEFGLYCVGASAGLMVMWVALGVMSVPLMAVVAAVVLAQKVLPPSASIDVPVALDDRRAWNHDYRRAGLCSGIRPDDVKRGIAGPTRERKERNAMTEHTIGTREEWLAARLELLEAEKKLTRRSDELTRRRQELPWVRIDKEYRFETDEGSASLADLFRGRSQLLIYHFMFGPEYTAGCPACSAVADGFDGFVVHLANHDVT
ncbi:MAG: DUF899 family protein, partial [bacterium]